jgi:hypothetical protein
VAGSSGRRAFVSRARSQTWLETERRRAEAAAARAAGGQAAPRRVAPALQRVAAYSSAAMSSAVANPNVMKKPARLTVFPY